MRFDFDIAIRGGRVLDPASGRDAVRDILIKNKRVVSPPAGREKAPAEFEVDAGGLIVVPGLVDIHCHMFNNSSDLGGPVDLMCLPMGVTAAVDPGTAGFVNFKTLVDTCIDPALVKCFACLHVNPCGIPTLLWHESQDPEYFDLEKMRECIARYPNLIKAIKIRMGTEEVAGLGFKPMEEALKIGDALGLPLVVHTSNPPGTAEDLVDMFRPGDIYAHVFNPRGNTFLDGNGRVKPAFRKARERGVVFDSSSARGHSSFPNVKAALEQDFPPDVLSTDLVGFSAYNPHVHSLAFIMTYFMAMGMTLENAVARATVNAAKALKLPDPIGAITEGGTADIAVFKFVEKPLTVRDLYGNPLKIVDWLVPQMTVADGRIVYRQIDFRHDESERPTM